MVGCIASGCINAGNLAIPGLFGTSGPVGVTAPRGTKPVIKSVAVNRGTRRNTVELIADASAPDDGPIDFEWFAPSGVFSATKGSRTDWSQTGQVGPTQVEVPLTLKVTGPSGESETTVIIVLVRPDGSVVQRNNPPSIRNIRAEGTGASSAAALLRLIAEATDPEDDPLTFAWYALRGTISGTGREVIWGPLGPAPSSEAVLLEVRDVSGDTARDAFVFRIDPGTLRVDVAPGVLAPGPVVQVSLPERRDLELPADVTVDRVEIKPGEQGTVLDAPDSDGKAESSFLTSLPLNGKTYLSNGSQNALLVWSSSSPQAVQVDWRGVVTALPDARVGEVVVTARSFLDLTKSTNFRVTVRARGFLAAEVK